MVLKCCLFFCLSFFLVNSLQSANNVNNEKRILMDDNNYYTILAKLGALEKEVTILKAENDKLDALEKEVTILKQQNPHSHDSVAFLAELTTTITGTGRHIYFDNVKLNQGNAYNPHHGTFVPPVNGTYLFSLTLCSAGGHAVVLQVNVNNDILGRMLAGDNSYDECSSKVLIAHLHAGDDVYVQQYSSNDYLYAYANYGYPLFTGVLINAD
ncbi:biological adhesion [Mactra antiquata]